MKITLLLVEQANNGENRNIAMFAEKLHLRGHDVTVVIADGKPDSVTSKLKGMLGLGKNQPDNPAFPPFSNDFYRFLVIPVTEQTAAKRLPDADVLVATCWRSARIASIAQLGKGTPVHFAQRYEGADGPDPAQIRKAWKLPLFKIVTSRKLADFIRKELGVSIYHVIHNSLDFKQFDVPPRSRNPLPRIGFLFSNIRADGTETAVATLERLRHDYPDLEALSISDGDLPDGHNLPPWIAHRAVNNEAAMRDALSECDIWLHSSSEHEFGSLPLAAMACRCPVVSTPVGAMPELIQNGRNGYLTYLVDHSALADSAERILQMSGDKWQKLSDYAHETATSYDWDEAAELLEYTLMTAVDHDTQNTVTSADLAPSSA